ncbi:hypothetical protein HK101_005450, partial [Irineochytrium annulatum]
HCMDNSAQLSQAMQNINAFLTAMNESEIVATSDIFYVLFAIWTLTLTLVGIFIFRPAVKLAQRQREAAIEVFFEIRQECCLQMYLQYRFEKSVAEDGDEGDLEETRSNFSDEEEDNDEGAVIYGRATSTFSKITTSYLTCLLILWAIFSLDVTFSTLWLQSEMSHAGVRLQRSATTPFLGTAFSCITTEIAVKDPFSSISTEALSNVLKYVLSTFKSYRVALLYGDAALNLPPAKLSPSERSFFFDKAYFGNTMSLDDVSTEFIDDAVRLLMLNNFTFQDPAYVRMFRNSPQLVTGYNEFSDLIDQNFHEVRADLSMFSTDIMYPLISFCLLFMYLKAFQKILHMIVDEARKTVRLLLMLPLTMIGYVKGLDAALSLGDKSIEIPDFGNNARSDDIARLMERLNKKKQEEAAGHKRASSAPTETADIKKSHAVPSLRASVAKSSSSGSTAHDDRFGLKLRIDSLGDVRDKTPLSPAPDYTSHDEDNFPRVNAGDADEERVESNTSPELRVSVVYGTEAQVDAAAEEDRTQPPTTVDNPFADTDNPFADPPLSTENIRPSAVHGFTVDLTPLGLLPAAGIKSVIDPFQSSSLHAGGVEPNLPKDDDPVAMARSPSEVQDVVDEETAEPAVAVDGIDRRGYEEKSDENGETTGGNGDGQNRKASFLPPIVHK